MYVCSILELATEELETMHRKGLLNRILELDKHRNEIKRIFGGVDEATKNFQVREFHCHDGTCTLHRLAARGEHGQLQTDQRRQRRY